MDIYVYVDGKTWGPLTRVDVEESLADGRLLPEHLGWHEAREAWIPLNELLAELTEEEQEPVVEAAAATGSLADGLSEKWTGRGIAGRKSRDLRSQRGTIEGITHRGQVVQRGEGSHEIIPSRTPHDVDKDNRAGVIFIITITIFALIGGGLYVGGVFDSFARKDDQAAVQEEERTRVSIEWRRMYLAGLSLELPFTPHAFKLILDEDVRRDLYDHEGYETTIGDVRVMIYTFRFRDKDFDPDAYREKMARQLFARMGGQAADMEMTPSDILISEKPTEGFRGAFTNPYGRFEVHGATTEYDGAQHWIGVAHRAGNLHAGPDADRVLGSLRLRSIEMVEEARARTAKNAATGTEAP